MKKLLGILFIVMTIFAITFAFCSCSSGVVGEWKATTSTVLPFEGADPYDQLSENISIYLNINNDETWEFIFENHDDPSLSYTVEGTYTFEDDKLIFSGESIDENVTTVFEYKDGKLYGEEVIEVDDEITTVITYVFERK